MRTVVVSMCYDFHDPSCHLHSSPTVNFVVVSPLSVCAFALPPASLLLCLRLKNLAVEQNCKMTQPQKGVYPSLSELGEAQPNQKTKMMVVESYWCLMNQNGGEEEKRDRLRFHDW